jgi:NTE family protein
MPSARSPDSRTALVLSGGNALGAYAAGAYETLHSRGYQFELISGASIGAINGAIIAGNVPERRVEKLREFWMQAGAATRGVPLARAGKPREIFNRAHVVQTLLFGRPGLFAPRVPGLLSAIPGIPSDVAIFDHHPGAATLLRVVDFDLLNDARVPLIVSAVEAQTGQLVHFDTRTQPLRPEHFLASTAMPPFYPPVTIDGRLLVDPGLVANLPLDPALDEPFDGDLLCIAVDAFSPNAEPLHDLDSVIERAQDILFAAQSYRTLDHYLERHRLRRVTGSREASRESAGDPMTASLREGPSGELTIVRIAYRALMHELGGKMLDFSKASIEERWIAGRDDMQRALDALDVRASTSRGDGYALYDSTRFDARRTSADGDASNVPRSLTTARQR